MSWTNYDDPALVGLGVGLGMPMGVVVAMDVGLGVGMGHMGGQFESLRALVSFFVQNLAAS
ncbi:hypothetical protein B0H13DRAFT_2302637 [Mycena leptocephala]|nr:hypothetical protein B0H13DRAFT_2302637 [Mycena leptocephala]